MHWFNFVAGTTRNLREGAKPPSPPPLPLLCACGVFAHGRQSGDPGLEISGAWSLPPTPPHEPPPLPPPARPPPVGDDKILPLFDRNCANLSFSLFLPLSSSLLPLPSPLCLSFYSLPRSQSQASAAFSFSRSSNERPAEKTRHWSKLVKK
jgi:hypothetical protein